MTHWQLGYGPDAVWWLRKADPQVARRVRGSLSALIANGEPRSRGRALTGQLSGLWRYRVGEYRIICDIRDAGLIVVAITIGKRAQICD